MKKGLLQRASKNWEDLPVDIKIEPILENVDLRKTVLESSKLNTNITTTINNNNNVSNTSSKSDNENIPLTTCKQQSRNVQSMISVRKDYSYKYTASSKSKTPSQERCLDMSSQSSSTVEPNVKKEIDCLLNKPLGLMISKEPLIKRTLKPNISILERHDYDKGPKVAKIEKFLMDDEIKVESDDSYSSAIEDYKTPPKIPFQMENLKNLTVPIERLDEEVYNNSKRKTAEKCGRDELKVIVAHEEEINTPPISSTIKQEQSSSFHNRQQTLSTESKDSQNINKINNKINIIFQLNDTTKRKNIILHRRTPKKMVQKITIKETNNNINNSINSTTKNSTDDATTVPEKVLCTTETQTEVELLPSINKFSMNMSISNPLTDELTEYLFFENDVLIALQTSTISFFEFQRLSSLLKKGCEIDFKLIDRTTRRMHDIQVDCDNKYQRLCYNDCNSLPIYIEMRAKQKELDDPEMCPIAFLYCNIYYVDQKRAKFSSVHLDTVKSVVDDIRYTSVPNSSYFIMSWHEKSLDTKYSITGIVKYKLTPNLDLAKLASIRQFPKLNYHIKQMYCGKDSQLITLGDTQVSIFNYESGDLLVSWDLMKSYGINLATITIEENYFFMVYLCDGDDIHTKRLTVIGIHRHDSNSHKVIQTLPVKIGRYETIVSRSLTSTNHLIVSFSSGCSLMMYLENFRDVHFKRSLESTLIASNDYIIATSVDNFNNVGLCHFTEFFLND